MGRPVSRRSAPPGGGGGVVGAPIYIPQNDPHDALIICTYTIGVKLFSRKICPSAQASISQRLTWRSGWWSIFLCFSPIFEVSTKF